MSSRRSVVQRRVQHVRQLRVRPRASPTIVTSYLVLLRNSSLGCQPIPLKPRKDGLLLASDAVSSVASRQADFDPSRKNEPGQKELRWGHNRRGFFLAKAIVHETCHDLCTKFIMIDHNEFLTLSGLEWGRAWESRWVNNVDDEFVSFIADIHTKLEDSRLRCALDLFRSYNSTLARQIAHQYVNDSRGPIRDAARSVFTAHHQRQWIDQFSQSDWRTNSSLEPAQLTKRQRQRQRKYGDPFARDRNEKQT